MKKIALTLGAALVAFTAVSVTNAEAGGKKLHFGWQKPHWNVYYDAPFYYGYPPVKCFWKKRKIFTPGGFYWKRVKICKPIHLY